MDNLLETASHQTAENMAEYVIYKYVFTKTDEINLFKQTEEGERIVLSAQEHLQSHLTGTSLLGLNKHEKDGTLTPLANKIVAQHEDVTLLQLCNKTKVAVWQDFKKEYHDNEPYCNIIIDNRTNVAQIAIEKSGAFGGKEGTDKVKSILEEFINNAVKPYGYQVEITRKLRSIEMWDMVADRIKQHDPIKYVRFNFRDPAETQAIDATEMQLKQLELMSALRKATGAVSSFMQMEASNTGTLILDKEQKDLSGMVGLCSNNGWDIDIHFRDFGIYRTGQLQSAVFPLNIAILNQFASDEGRIEFEGPEGELDLILWLDNIRDITKDYDYNDSTANIRRKGKAKK